MREEGVIKDRINWIDVAKGITIVLMIIGHSVTFGSLTRNIIYSFHMPLFFVLAGYTLSNNDLYSSTKKDFKRLIVPIFITLMIDALLSIVILKSSVFSAILFNLYKLVWGNCDNYGPNEGALYSTEFIGLFVLWFFIALFLGKVFYRMMCNKIKKHRMIILLVMSFIAMEIGTVIWLPYCIDLIPIVMVFLEFGQLLKNKADMECKKWSVVGVAALFLWIYFVVEEDIYIEIAARIYKGSVLGILVAFLGCIVMIQVSQSVENLCISKPFIFFGRNSLDLVCIHYLDKFIKPYWNIVIFPADSNKAVINIVLTCIIRLAIDLIVLIIWVYIKKLVKSLFRK